MNNKSFRKFSKDKARMAWMRDFEAQLAGTQFRQGICWDTATHLFNIGKTPSDAAATMIRIITEEGKR